MLRNFFVLMFAVIFLSGVVVNKLYAYSTAYSSLPMPVETKMISTEFAGVTSSGRGVGIDARYIQKVNELVMVDAGFGFSNGEYARNFFVGADYEVYPDHMTQPRFSLKGTIERAQEFGVSVSKFGVAPTISKGMSFWGREGFPYASMPWKLNLDGESNTYKTSLDLALGISGRVPVQGYSSLNANIEMNVGLKDSYTGIAIGISYPIQ